MDAEAEYQHISSCHDKGLLSAVISMSVSTYARQGTVKSRKRSHGGLGGCRTLQEPQEQVPAQELEQQEVQELSRENRGQQRFAADDGVFVDSRAVPHEPVVQS